MKKVMLIILDGWGIAKDKSVSAIDKANTPEFRALINKYANSKLEASGEAVGLPAGQMGNSEVGHMNLGAGRVVEQELTRLNKGVLNGELAKEPVLVETFNYAKTNNKKLHFIGLVSDGGIHAHISHLEALLAAAQQHGLSNVFVHAFTDGRDTDPKSGAGFITDLQAAMAKTTGKLASVIGRFYAMDRDKRWERVKEAYDLMVHGTGTPTTDPVAALKASYEAGVTDEFIKPIVVTENNKPVAVIEDGDVVLCFNFRTDRGREISIALTQEAFPEQNMKPLNLYYVTLTKYEDSFKNVKVVIENAHLPATLGEVIEKAGLKQIRIAETEKYPHVTFFFSGGREEPFTGETRILKPSPKDVKTYDLKPEMSAADLTEAIIPELEKQEASFVCLNYANTDMVGHTGVFEAEVKAAETVDACLAKLLPVALANGYSAVILADHGNGELMINPDGSPNTAHTTNLVPCIIMDPDFEIGKGRTVKDGKLGDIAPTILSLMGLQKPAIMTGNSLV